MRKNQFNVIDLTFTAEGKGKQAHSTRLHSDEENLTPDDIFPFMDEWVKKWCIVEEPRIRYTISLNGVVIYDDFKSKL